MWRHGGTMTHRATFGFRPLAFAVQQRPEPCVANFTGPGKQQQAADDQHQRDVKEVRVRHKGPDGACNRTPGNMAQARRASRS